MYNLNQIPKIYSLDEVSKILDIPKGTLYNMKWKGILPCIKIGKRIKMTENQVLQLLNMGETSHVN
mgnify:FL=1